MTRASPTTARRVLRPATMAGFAAFLATDRLPFKGRLHDCARHGFGGFTAQGFLSDMGAVCLTSGVAA